MDGLGHLCHWQWPVTVYVSSDSQAKVHAHIRMLLAPSCYQWKHMMTMTSQASQQAWSDNGTIKGQQHTLLTCAPSEQIVHSAHLWSTHCICWDIMNRWETTGCSLALISTISQSTRLPFNTNSALTPSLDAVTVQLKLMCVTLCRTPSFPLG